MPRNTSSGKIYEKEIEKLLKDHTDYEVKSQVTLGLKRNGKKHRADLILDEDIIISLKYQKVEGTAEEKVPFEVMKLQHAIADYGYQSAVLVLAGVESAWKWQEYYLSDEFKTPMKMLYPNVNIMSHKTFLEEFLVK